MVNHRLERALEMKRLHTELKRYPAGSDESECRWARVDELLDKDLADRGAHAADCGCGECARTVSDVLARRLGECIDPRDIAVPGQW